MKIKEKMEEAINKQINREFYSAYLYLSMAAYFESLNLKGFSHWMGIQAKEEVEHGMKLYNYLIDRNGRVVLEQIEKPKVEWGSSLQAVEEVYKHEQEVTNLINSLFELADKEQDHATKVALQWFITEQVEEEALANEIVEKLKLAGDQGHGLFLLDRELAERKEG